MRRSKPQPWQAQEHRRKQDGCLGLTMPSACWADDDNYHNSVAGNKPVLPAKPSAARKLTGSPQQPAATLRRPSEAASPRFPPAGRPRAPPLPAPRPRRKPPTDPSSAPPAPTWPAPTSSAPPRRPRAPPSCLWSSSPNSGSAARTPFRASPPLPARPPLPRRPPPPSCGRNSGPQIRSPCRLAPCRIARVPCSARRGRRPVLHAGGRHPAAHGGRDELLWPVLQLGASVRREWRLGPSGSRTRAAGATWASADRRGCPTRCTASGRRGGSCAWKVRCTEKGAREPACLER